MEGECDLESSVEKGDNVKRMAAQSSMGTNDKYEED